MSLFKQFKLTVINPRAASEKRRHSEPEPVLASLPLTTILENDNTTTPSKLSRYMRKMSISPTINSPKHNSPKTEKRSSFTFFRSRTLSGSSNESNPSSPRLSPRSIFDRVRKRSQTDSKVQTTTPSTTANDASNNSSNGNKKATGSLLGPPPTIIGGGTNASSSRKRLSHSISEEKDEHETNNNDYTELNYKTYHGPSASSSTNYHTKQLITNLSNLHVQNSMSKQNSTKQLKTSFNDLAIENHQIFAYFMKHKCCYDIMPKSAKIVVFDTQLLVKKAFFALIYNGVRAAPLWDSKNQKFVGMLTITDFILILQKYYRQPNTKIEELEEHKIDTWREVLKDYRRQLVSLRPDDSLFDAVRVLTENHVHRLPIIDPTNGNVLCIVTHKRILRYLYLFIYDMPQPQFLQQSISELGVGSFINVQTIHTSTPIIEALNIFVSTRVSALPIVDDNKKLVNIYSKFDVIDLAAEKTYNNLNITVTEALNYRKNRFEGVASCTKNESLAVIMERIVNKEVHRLVIVDENNCVLGIVSLSDILSYIVLKQEQPMQKATSTSMLNALSSSTNNKRDSNGSSLNTSAVFEDDMMETETTK